MVLIVHLHGLHSDAHGVEETTNGSRTLVSNQTPQAIIFLLIMRTSDCWMFHPASLLQSPVAHQHKITFTFATKNNPFQQMVAILCWQTIMNGGRLWAWISACTGNCLKCQGLDPQCQSTCYHHNTMPETFQNGTAMPKLPIAPSMKHWSDFGAFFPSLFT